MKWLPIILVFIIFISCSWTRIDELPYGKTRTMTVYKSERGMNSPHLFRLNSGDLVMVFHVPADSMDGLDAICLVVSTNNGKSWNKPDTVVHTDRRIYDPHLTQFPDGLIIVSFCQSRKMSEADVPQPIGCFLVKSYDNGKSFTAPAMISIPGYEKIWFADAIHSTGNGSWMLPAFAHKSNQQTDAIVAFSFDGGLNWEDVTVIVENASPTYQDFTLIRTFNKNWMGMLARQDDMRLDQTFSNDNGKNWSSVSWSGIYGGKPALGVTADGTVLSVYKDQSPQGIGCCRSYDLGKSWEDEWVLSEKNLYAEDPTLLVLNHRVMTNYLVKENQTGKSTMIQLTYFDQRPPAAPRGFNGSASKNQKVHLRWNSVSGAYYYNIYRSEAFKDSSFIDSLRAGMLVATTQATSFYDKNLNSGFMYQYQISAALGQGQLLPHTGNEGEKTKPLTITIK